MSFLSAFLPSPPDPTSSQPFTQTATIYLFHYVLAVLAILPDTFILKLAILPAILWQAWKIAVNPSRVGNSKFNGTRFTRKCCRNRRLKSYVCGAILSSIFFPFSLSFC